MKRRPDSRPPFCVCARWLLLIYPKISALRLQGLDATFSGRHFTPYMTPVDEAPKINSITTYSLRLSCNHLTLLTTKVEGVKR